MSTRRVLAIVVAVLYAAVFLVTLGLGQSATHATLRLYAGDLPLPGERFLPASDAAAELFTSLGEAGRIAYLQWWRLDWLLLGVALLLVISVAALGYKSRVRRHPTVLVVLGLIAALFDAAENAFLWLALSQGGSWSAWAAAATTAKWVAWAGCALWLVLVTLLILGSGRAWATALFGDVPSLIDSMTRRLDYRLHREFKYDAASRTLRERPFWKRPIFWFHAALVTFIGFGPTPDGLCTAVGSEGARGVLMAGAAVVFFFAIPRTLLAFRDGVKERLKRRAEREPAAGILARRHVIWAVMWPCGLALVAPFAVGSHGLWTSASEGASLPACAGVEVSVLSVAHLIACLVAIIAFARACDRITDSLRLLHWQIGLLVGFSALHWFLFAQTGASEASNLPYRHGGIVVILLLCLVMFLAPRIARTFFVRIGDDSGKYFRSRLSGTELFSSDRGDPGVTSAFVLHAFVKGALYHPLQVLLMPSLLALMAPADGLDLIFWIALALSVFLLTWGTLSPRWRQIVLQMDRWLMSGLAYPVSLFVIAIALLRLTGVQYVSTLLDAAPFGAVFGLVLMSYVLSWTVEYWINRIAACELLGMLGGEGACMQVPCDLDDTAATDVYVERADRYMMSHGLGRVLVVGKTSKPRGDGRDDRFHSHNLLGVFALLSEPIEHAHFSAVTRAVNNFFYSMSALMGAAILGFASYVLWNNVSLSRVAPGLVADAQPDAAHLADLAGRLVDDAGDGRPAVVVAASGGGTRAALYTTHLLQGLNGIGAGRDVVLLSGVSGGGVALAYFAAHFEKLTGTGGPAVWDEFRERMARSFIQDVLEGASEWRIFSRAPLTELLTESFDRHLFCLGKPCAPSTFAGLRGPALILNTAVAGHPAEDSVTLSAILQEPGADCVAHEHPFNNMSGGRLIFTNLSNVTAFPGQRVDSDVRLPYRIVRDGSVQLSRAAALNANFPPVFQNARVRIRNAQASTPCPDRDYFVTDGGAQENLGLLSALYALRGALEQIRDCAHCSKKLRPIHLVLAEASAAGYDYAQDRGLDAAIGGAKERLTGGLTGELIASIQQTQSRILGTAGQGPQLVTHTLALPLAFRARGGIGTHWMQAGRFNLTDPRARIVPDVWDRMTGTPALQSVSIDANAVCEIWRDLHSPRADFCTRVRPYNDVKRDSLRRWICGAEQGKDLHVTNWHRLTGMLQKNTAPAGTFSCRAPGKVGQ